MAWQDEDLGCPFQQHGGVFIFGVCHSAGPPLLVGPVRALLWAQVDVAWVSERLRCPGKRLCRPWGAGEQKRARQLHPANPRSPACVVTWGQEQPMGGS